jgi:hypothetical protein
MRGEKKRREREERERERRDRERERKERDPDPYPSSSVGLGGLGLGSTTGSLGINYDSSVTPIIGPSFRSSFSPSFDSCTGVSSGVTVGVRTDFWGPVTVNTYIRGLFEKEDLFVQVVVTCRLSLDEATFSVCLAGPSSLFSEGLAVVEGPRAYS